jgi:hypothetical protein
MRNRDAEPRLRELLIRAGVNVEAPTAQDVERTWQVFQEFAVEPVDDALPPPADGDGILAQFGIYDWGEGAHFELDMTRQIIVADDEYDGDDDQGLMTQLQCTFRFEVRPELERVGSGDLWSFDLALPEFFDQALAMQGFRAIEALAPEPVALVLTHEVV